MLRFLLPVEFRADWQVFPRLLLPECNVLSQRIGANIAAPLNAWSDYQPIRFIDALDRRREISFEWCEMWEVCHLNIMAFVYRYRANVT